MSQYHAPTLLVIYPKSGYCYRYIGRKRTGAVFVDPPEELGLAKVALNYFRVFGRLDVPLDTPPEGEAA